MSEATEETVVNPAEMPIDDLKSLIESQPAAGEEVEAPVQTEEAETPAETEQAPDASVEAEAPQQEVVADPEAVARKLRDERLDLLASQNEDLRKKYVELQKHSSRLASQLGRSRSEQAEDYPDDQRVPEVLEERFRRLEERQNRDAARQAVQEEFGRFDSRPEVKALKLEPEILAVASRHQERVRALSDMTDPDEARLTARDIAVTVLSEAIAERMKASAARSAESAAQAPARIAAKKASATLSNSGGTRATVRKPAPTPATMPLDDLKALIEATRPE